MVVARVPIRGPLPLTSTSSHRKPLWDYAGNPDLGEKALNNHIRLPLTSGSVPSTLLLGIE